MNSRSVMHLRSRNGAYLAAIPISLLFCANSWAQTSEKAPEKSLENVTITSSPLRENIDRQITPTLLLQRGELQSKLGSTLGEVLEQEAGIGSSGHGPNASRPIIRGLDNDRVRILNNGTGVFDASSTSADHAVAINPIFAERIEVLRGSSALRYGGSAVGGVVNVLDERTPVNAPNGSSGEVRLSGRTGTAQDTAAARYSFGTAAMAFSADVFDIRSGDVKVPNGLLPNSSGQTQGGSLGGALRGNWGYAGLSVQNLKNNYGIGNPASEEKPRIDLQQDRTEFKGRLNLSGPLEALEFSGVESRYQHSEIPPGEPAEVTFKNKGQEYRLEAIGNSGARFKTNVGVHYQASKFGAFDAQGNNSFLPNTRTQGTALYGSSLLKTSVAEFNAGVRHENHSVQGDSSTACGNAAQRNFNLSSASLGGRLPLPAGHSLSAQLNHTERAPSYQELFACGRHEATFNAQYGDNSLAKEKANGLDVSWAFKSDPWDARVTAYEQRFSNFITLRSTGDRFENNSENGVAPADLPSVAFSGTQARLRGTEWSLVKKLSHKTFGLSDSYTPKLEFRFDQVNGQDESTGMPLPRITPKRLTTAASLNHASGYLRIQLTRHFEQNRINVDEETATAGYNRLDVYGAWRPNGLDLPGRTELFIQGRNLTNSEGRNHSSFLKEFITLPGRTLTVGIRTVF
ncbi:MAG: TonB-dependent receptor [Burkholderiales bacterium]|nr:TonB-dependent receptor [Burkholderiales bacterium]